MKFPGDTEEHALLTKRQKKNIRKMYTGVAFCGKSVSPDSIIRLLDAQTVAVRAVVLNSFEAYQLCPRCLTADFHGFTGKIYCRKFIQRLCNSCGCEWEQS